MQGEADRFSPEMSLQISRADLTRHFEEYLREGRCPDAFHLVDKVLHRLHARDAILVKYGTDRSGQDQFGFVHRSFQEYFAAVGWRRHSTQMNSVIISTGKSKDGMRHCIWLSPNSAIAGGARRCSC